MDESTLNDLLECSVCLERLNTSSKVLPCQHTFCRKCLEVIVASRQELRCPECRILVSVKIDDLPPNVLLMRILGGLKTATAANKAQEDLQQKNLESDKQFPQQQQKQFFQTQHQQKPQEEQNPQASLQTQQQPQTNLISSQRRCLLPHAYALYDFDSSEPTDLHFKKGDLILLKHKIDANWYVGQLNGIEGTFPSNYVQVIVALPSPQCLALYDFKMGANEEEGCLNFKKGALIHVLRRVDDNWAEGRIGNMIGIFPIAFVELNMLAKQLLGNIDPKVSLTSNSGSNMNNYSSSKPQCPQSYLYNTSTQQSRNVPPIPLIDPTTSPSSSSLSNTTSPSASDSAVSNNRLTNITTTTTNSSSSNASLNSNSMPNSPQQSLPSTPQHYALGSGSVRYRDGREKRHSLNALLSSSGNASPALSILHTNRHSAEILSIPSEELIVSNNTSVASNNQSHELPNNAVSSVNAVPQTSLSREQRQSSTLQPPTVVSTRANVLKSACGNINVPPSLPWGYLALYPYKPRKNDELELKKGCVYIVTERCLDGWFKGKNWQDISGVFPGNYVTPLRARDQQQLMHQWKFVPQPQSSQLAISPPSAIAPIILGQENISARNTTSVLPKHHTPPELPPRHLIATTTCSSVWTKPLSHTVEAFFNRSSTISKASTSQNEGNSSEKPKDKESKSKDSSTSAAVSLMKRLTHIKSIKSQAKSPAQTSKNALPSPSVQQNNFNTSPNNLMDTTKPETIGDILKANSSQLATIQPVHVRSGSCPSQLLQNLPHELSSVQVQNGDRHQKAQQQTLQPSQPHPTILHHGSERIKGHKERPRIQATRQSMDGTLRRAIYNNVTATTPSLPYTVPNNLLLNSKCAQQHQMQQQIGSMPLNNTAQDIYGTHHRKSQSLDANNTLMGVTNTNGPTPPLPPSAPVFSMQNSNIAAAIAASATTKSAYSGRESRFRCIVPYPPNSDVELELHVGDIIYVQRKQKNGWYKGTHARTQETGLFPASFVEPDL